MIETLEAINTELVEEGVLMQQDKMYSTSDLAEFFEVERATVFNWVKAGLFPHVQQVGRNYGVPSSDVQAFIESKISRCEEEILEWRSLLDKLEK